MGLLWLLSQVVDTVFPLTSQPKRRKKLAYVSSFNTPNKSISNYKVRVAILKVNLEKLVVRIIKECLDPNKIDHRNEEQIGDKIMDIMGENLLDISEVINFYIWMRIPIDNVVSTETMGRMPISKLISILKMSGEGTKIVEKIIRNIGMLQSGVKLAKEPVAYNLKNKS